MSGWSLRLLGVGNASAVELGSAMATIERDGAPWLTIDCGGEGLTAYQRAYGGIPAALFMTHAHMDHIAGFERLFVAGWFDPAHRGEVRLYVPATLLPLLQQRVASYPNALAEGGVNFWDAFRVVPVGAASWLRPCVTVESMSPSCRPRACLTACSRCRPSIWSFLRTCRRSR